MELQQLIDALSRPEAYPFSVDTVEVCQTHISIVFLAGDFAYKIKKPVELGFLDFSTLERRHHFCREEVELNRRLAPKVYVGVVSVNRNGGGLHFEGQGEVIEWAVKMQRLPDDAALEQQLHKGEVDEETLQRLAQRLARFYAAAQSNEHVSSFGRFETVAGNARENFEQSRLLVGKTVNGAVFDRIQQLTEKQLQELQPLIEERAKTGRIRDTHGDLRLDHVYLFPERNPPDDLVIIDCIEFNERFRFADPVADVAFLIMDFLYSGHHHFARVFTDAYITASGDEAGRQLVPFYIAYRAVVRGKVEGMKALEKEVAPAQQEQAFAEARGHWLLALVELAEPIERPCLLLVGGLPGTGKSTLARELAKRANFHLIRSDVIRKELAGLHDSGNDKNLDAKSIYTPEWNDKTYRECLKRAGQLLFEGKRVIIDATFREEKFRRLFLEEALHLGVPGLFLCCTASVQIVKERLAARHGDVSDADWNIYEMLAQSWEKTGSHTRQRMVEIKTDGAINDIVVHAMSILRRHHLA